ncbi:endoribonuclease L-PSP domain-containing protein (plasmid) [Rhizobium etli 8C-3]|uniref:Endoribonuclease L-PSP domain-containing protein n=1 Tax=Rhizobium etli 8C-3 TaxID=538025 RepID=A0A1L5PD23_RHIET|nr:endoribonuclease L-PSP domain-containing protein [Rhizobium etli 8C-3]
MGLVYLAGQVAESRKAHIEVQTRDVLCKIDVLLKEAGMDRSRLIAVTVFLPARACVEVASPIPICASNDHARRPLTGL